MTPPDQYLYEYSVIRYVPRVDREEFINIGLLMLCKRQKWLKGEVVLNTERLRAFDPRLNIETLQQQLAFFKRQDVPDPQLPVEEKYRWLASVKSAVIQTSPSHPGYIKINDAPLENQGFVNALEREFTRLLKLLVL